MCLGLSVTMVCKSYLYVTPFCHVSKKLNKSLWITWASVSVLNCLLWLQACIFFVGAAVLAFSSDTSHP